MLIVFCVFQFSCESDANDKKIPTSDLEFYGDIDPSLSVYSSVYYTLKADKRKCKSWDFNLFAGGDAWTLIQKIKSFESYPVTQSNTYELVVPLSKLDRHSDCNPVLESVRMCIYEKLPKEERCNAGFYLGDTLVWCAHREVYEGKDCSAYVTVFSQSKNESISNLGYSYAAINCDSKSVPLSCRMMTTPEENIHQDSYLFDIKKVPSSK